MNAHFKSRFLALVAVLLCATPAAADGFSAELTVPVNPFSASLALHYSVEVVPNLLVGASLDGRVAAGPSFSLGGRLGAVYVFNLIDSNSLKADAYAGAGVTFNFLDTFYGNPDLRLGLFVRNWFDKALAAYGRLDGILTLNTVSGQFVPSISGLAGLDFTPIERLEAYLEARLGYALAFNYDLKLGVYYNVLPQLRIGLVTGYGNGAFNFALRGLFTDKPGTLGTPGNYLP